MDDRKTSAILLALRMNWPTDWTALFGADKPLILDIGFGYGHSLRYLQAHRPAHHIVGLEVDHTSMRKAERVIAREQWPHVRVVQGFAELALQHLFLPQSLQEIHVNFPDPWFKARHAGRRLMKRPTLNAMVSRLKPGGVLYVATDISEYAQMTHALLADTPGLTNALTMDWVDERPEPFITKYEKRAKKEGRTCHYFVYQRNAHPVPSVPTIEELPMPHIVFKTPLDLDAMLEQINVPTYSDDTVSVQFLHRYRGQQSLLFEVFIREPTLDQRIAVVLAEKDDEPGVFTLKLSSLGYPRATVGVHQAVRLLGDALLALHPDMTVIHDKVRADS
jgi:tRNA (guanine-N7-)-methyltransferase